MGVSHHSSTLIHCDNQSAIQIAHNDIFHERTKYIEIECHFICHHFLEQTLRLVPIATTTQKVDIFTKSHPPGQFLAQVSKLIKLASTFPH